MAHNGNAALGMWFLQEEIALAGDGGAARRGRRRSHAGDILVQSGPRRACTIE